MSIQSQINGLVGQVAATTVATSVADAAKLEKNKAAEEAAKVKSYGNDLNKVLGEAVDKYPEFKDPDMFNKALDLMEGKRNMMLAQREAVRAYRNKYAPGSDEADPVKYAQIEDAGQKRRKANLNAFSEELDQLRKGGK